MYTVGPTPAIHELTNCVNAQGHFTLVLCFASYNIHIDLIPTTPQDSGYSTYCSCYRWRYVLISSCENECLRWYNSLLVRNHALGRSTVCWKRHKSTFLGRSLKHVSILRASNIVALVVTLFHGMQSFYTLQHLEFISSCNQGFGCVHGPAFLYLPHLEEWVSHQHYLPSPELTHVPNIL